MNTPHFLRAGLVAICASTMAASGAWAVPEVTVANPAPKSATATKKAKAKKAKAVPMEVAVFMLQGLSPQTPKKQVRMLERSVKKVKGVKRVAVSKKRGELVLRHTKMAKLASVRAAVRKAGFTVVDPTPAHEAGDTPAPGGDAPDGSEIFP